MKPKYRVRQRVQLKETKGRYTNKTGTIAEIHRAKEDGQIWFEYLIKYKDDDIADIWVYDHNIEIAREEKLDLI